MNKTLAMRAVVLAGLTLLLAAPLVQVAAAE